MSKPPSPPSNPFVRSETFAKPEAPVRSATAGFGSGMGSIASGNLGASGEAGAPAPRSAVAGASTGKSIANKPLASGDIPAAKKNPFERKVAVGEEKTKSATLAPGAGPAGSIKQPDAKTETPAAKTEAGTPAAKTGILGSESGNASTTPIGRTLEVVTTASGLEVTHVKAPPPEEFAQRLKESQKPVTTADIKEVTADNYTKFYKLQESEKAEAAKAEAITQAEIKKAEDIATHGAMEQARAAQDLQNQQTINAALAAQARDLQIQIASFKNQAGLDDEQKRLNALRVAELEHSLYQIPSRLW